MFKYLARHLESQLLDYAESFKVVLLTGARQVGKSTLLKHMFPGYRSYVFDPIEDRYNIREDPELFLRNLKPPVIFDEIQYMPELLPALKRYVDESDARGQFLLTGSQNLSMLSLVTESLAGRVGILHLEGMTFNEIEGRGHEAVWLESYLNDPGDFFESILTEPEMNPEHPIVDWIWKGSFPEVFRIKERLIPAYYSSYVQTYLERDVRLLEGVQDLTQFERFLRVCAALTAQEQNMSHLGREIGISGVTARRWLSVLQHSFQWLEIEPYSGNTIKRISGKSKGYLRDTGLGCYLQRVSSPDALLGSPQLGAWFETLVVNWLYRQTLSMPVPPQLYHWRTNAGAEVDLILERDGALYPIEVKCKTKISGHDLKGIRSFQETYAHQKVMPALLIYAGNDAFLAASNILVLPVWYF